MQRELHIDCEEAMRGGRMEQKEVGVRKFGGASYEVEADGVSWIRAGKKRSAETDAAPSAPPAKRRCRREDRRPPVECANSAGASKKRKRESDTPAREAEFLSETIKQLKKVKVPSASSRQAELRMMLPYLKTLRPTSS